MRRIVLLTLVAGCFGDGATPTGPSDATVVFSAGSPPAKHDCSGSSHYIGDVAFTADHGYAFTLQFRSQQCGGDSSSMNEVAPLSEFALAGGAVKSLGTVPSDSNVIPRIAANDGPFSVTLHGNQIAVGPDVGAWNPPTSPFTPVAAVADSTALWVIGSMLNTTGAAEPNNPNYPCCGPSGGSLSGSFIKIVLPVVGTTVPIGMPISPACTNGTMAECLVQNTSGLYYMTESTGHVAAIHAFPKAGTTAAQDRELATIDGGGVPVGLAADDQNVVWAVSPVTGNLPAPSPRCAVFAYNLASEQMTQLLVTSQFSCKDVAVSGEFVYFAIVDVVDGTNGAQEMFGRGLGRIDINTKAFESIDVSMVGFGAGIRRVHVSPDGETLFGIDPYALARFSVHTFEGKQEIAK